MKRSNERSLKEVLDAMVEATGMRARLDEQAIRSFWSDLAGAMIARHTAGMRLMRGRLHLKVDSAPLRHELTYQREGLARMINERMGREVVQEVVIE
jgi:predicted nucleic acid-binding Zn ribbon protein